MVALGKQGLNNLGELECWLFLVAGRSGIVGFIEHRVGSRWSGWGEGLVTEDVCEEPGHQGITLTGPFGSQGICGAVVVKLAKVD